MSITVSMLVRNESPGLDLHMMDYDSCVNSSLLLSRYTSITRSSVVTFLLCLLFSFMSVWKQVTKFPPSPHKLLILCVYLPTQLLTYTHSLLFD